jgi:hypothetical protein
VKHLTDTFKCIDISTHESNGAVVFVRSGWCAERLLVYEFNKCGPGHDFQSVELMSVSRRNDLRMH